MPECFPSTGRPETADRAPVATASLTGGARGGASPYGSAENFRNCYDPTWGKYKKRTKPAVGNDENYNSTTAAGPYFDYFGARSGARGKGYYSYDRGAGT